MTAIASPGASPSSPAEGGGIGRAIALALAAEGARVAVVARSSSQCQSVTEEIGGGRARHLGRRVLHHRGGAAGRSGMAA